MGNLVLNIRGTHGTGKTYISHKLIEDHEHAEKIEPKVVLGKNFTKTNCFEITQGVTTPIRVVGRWKSGMDGIFPQEIVEEMIEYWAEQGHVIWENVMVSGNIGRWAVLANRLDADIGTHHVWLYMDTPLQTCIDRVFARRAAAAERGFNHRQDNADVKLDVLAQHWRRVRRSALRALDEGIDVRWIDHRYAYEQVHNLLVAEAGWQVPAIEGVFDELRPWHPHAADRERMMKTAILPWESDDTMTKVDYVSKPRLRRGQFADDELGVTIRPWGWVPETEEQLGTPIASWSEYHSLVA